jgi:trehalose-phosphatase
MVSGIYESRSKSRLTMKYFFRCLSKITKEIQLKNCIFMFDFDGTLSKIAKTPEEAYLEESTKKTLRDLSKKNYLAIISGRELSDVKNKVGITGLIYAGNHGLEWEIGGKRNGIIIPLVAKNALEETKKIFKIVAKKYPGVLIEGKGFSLSVHYRKITQKKTKIFLQELKRNNYFINNSKLLSVTKGKKVLEIRPSVNWNKGMFIKFLLGQFNSKFFPIYIGDDTTDETAFRILQKGITIRMGKKQQSYAKYFIKINEMDKLLLWFIKNLPLK